MSAVGNVIQPGGPCWKCGLTVGDIVDRGAGAYADGRLRFMHAGGECPTVDTLPPELKRRLAVPGPQQADASPLLDLVGQYGDKRVEAVSVEECGGDGEPYKREAAVLLARLDREIDRMQAAVIDAGGLVDTYQTQRDEARAQRDQMQDNAETWRREAERLKAAQPDPLKLSLPEVPEDTEALVGVDGDRYRWIGDGSDQWEALKPRPGWRGQLGALLDREGTPVTVELAPPREPRTAAEVWASISETGRAFAVDHADLREALDREAGL